MKKFNTILPLLAILLLLTPGITVQAARTEKYNAGTKKATINIELKNVLSCEGEVTVSAKEKTDSITINEVKAAATQNAFCETNGNKLFMVASQSSNLTVTIDVTMSGDGIYYVYLDGGVTGKDGTYAEHLNDKEFLEVISLEVGTSDSSSTSDSSNKSDASTSDSSNKSDASTSNSSKDSDSTKDSLDDSSDKEITSSDKTKDKTDTTITKNEKDTGKKSVDYTALKQALKNADELISDNDELKEWQTLINQMNNGNLLLSSENQEQVDETAKEIQELIDQMSGDSKENGSKNKRTSKSFKVSEPIKYILIGGLVLLILIGCLLIWWLRRKKKHNNNYAGAPMVDYDIGDDD